MEFDLMQWLAPVLFIILWGLSRALMHREREQEESEHPSQTENQDHAEQIREEIRRRIAKRQRKQREAPTGAPSPPLTPVAPSYESDHQPEPEVLHPPEQKPLAPAYPTVKVVPRSPAPVEDDLHEKLVRQIAQLREAQRQSEEIRRSVSVPYRLPQPSAGRANLQKDVLKALNDSLGVRKAFIYAEVLGVPVSMRRQRGFLQFWD